MAVLGEMTCPEDGETFLVDLDQVRQVTLTRFAHTPFGTFGRMRLPGNDHEPIYTVEDKWAANKVGQSCIPAGTYRCVPRRYNGGGYDAIHVTNVPGRTFIIIHIGNDHLNTEGCILPGFGLGTYRGNWAVLRSKDAFNFIMDWFNDQPFDLVVQDLRVSYT